MKRSRGNMLAIVVSILFILLVLIMGLHVSQSRAVRGVTQAEAEIQFRQSFEFAVAKLLAKEEPLPSALRVSAGVNVLEDSDLKRDYGKSLFTGLVNLDPKDKEYAPGFRTYRMDPTTSDASLKVFADRREFVVAQTDTGYSAYAPKGKITLEEATGWANPTLDDERKSAEAFSGVPVLLAALSDIQVDNLRYGSAYSKEGSPSVSGEGAIGFKGNFPLRSYEQTLQNELDSLKTGMAGATSGGNKTSSIKGDHLETVKSMVSLIFGGGGQPDLSLQQAMEVPFPGIPGGSITIPGLFYEFWVHMPYPPDFASFDDPSQRNSEEDAKEAQRIYDEIKKVEKEIQELQKKKAAATSEDARKDIQKQIDSKEKRKTELEEEADDLRKKMEDDAGRRNKAVEGKIGSPPNQPVTRRDDKNISKTGIKGWAYGPVFKGFGKLLVSLITGDFEGMAGAFFNKVRVIHFGGKDYEPDFRFDGRFFAKATMNVPPGRTLRYNGNVEIEGDLWLQKGSVFSVGGNLTLQNPNPSANNPFLPSGRLVLEEGAALVVDGDVTLAGSDKFGSLWVCAPAGRLHPISTAILANGTVNIPYGSYTSTNLEDASRWLAAKESSFDFLPSVLETIFRDIAPNLSKIAGPFHTRQPFFASYAATFQLTMVPTPVGPVPVPSCIPLPRKNVLVPIFRGFTYLYTPTMNAAIGENFVTHTDWWGFGEGVVPVIPKIDPIRMVNGLGSVKIGSLNFSINWEQQLNKLKNEVLEKAMNFVIETVVKKVIKQVVTSFLPGGGILGAVVDEAMDLVSGESDALQELQDSLMDATIGPIVDELERWVNNLRKQVEDGIAEGYLREVNGPLVYADQIVVGDGTSTVRLFAGMLVAKSGISIEANNFVGSMVALNGDITAKRLYFNPHFTKASLYKPSMTDSSWIIRAVEYRYGSKLDSQQALGISSGVNIVRTESWNK